MSAVVVISIVAPVKPRGWSEKQVTVRAYSTLGKVNTLNTKSTFIC